MNTPKLHHYVPRFYLRRFLDKDQRLWVFDKVTQKIFQTIPESIAAETHFYRIPDLIDTEHDSLFLEKEFSALESVVSDVTDRWFISMRDLRPTERVEITDEERHDLSLYISLQFLRTLEQREILAAFAIQEGLYKTGMSVDEKVNLHAALLWNSSLVNDIATRVYESIWIFGRNTTNTPFLTSDNPVCFKTPDHRMWLKASGVLSPGTYVVFPLSPEIIFYCKEPGHWAKLKKFDACISPVTFSKEMVEHENSGQVFMASRFVISNCNDFDFVPEFIASIGTDIYAPKERNEGADQQEPSIG